MKKAQKSKKGICKRDKQNEVMKSRGKTGRLEGQSAGEASIRHREVKNIGHTDSQAQRALGRRTMML